MQVLNREAPWDQFDSRSYVDHNYRILRTDDEEIIRTVRKYFAEHFRGHTGPPVSGIDVGAGANLYPALAMLPWCEEITLYERSRTNVTWLSQQADCFGPDWDQFWEALLDDERSHPPLDTSYAQVLDPRAKFASSVRVELGDLFDLEDRRWGVGTMFFVAESMSSVRHEFEGAVARFLRALAPGAPFAAAFMENSRGYEVGDLSFPAYPVDKIQVRDCLEKDAEGVRITEIGIPGDPLRDGYTGMLLACGRRAAS